MNILTVDIGNSLVKLDLWNENTLLKHLSGEEIDRDQIAALASEYDIEGVIVSSVRKEVEGLAQGIEELTGCRVVVFNQKEISRYSDDINYRLPIGSDRIAAYLGALEICKEGGVLIVDAGTAMTIDVCSHDGKFCGGNISLGLRSRLKAIAKAGSLLPEVKDEEESDYFGHDTNQALWEGASNGMISEIIYSFKKAAELYKTDKIMLTGGDCEWLHRNLKNEYKNLIVDPYLVSRGLNRHFRKFYVQIN